MSGLSELQENKRANRLATALCKAGACLTNDEMRLIVSEFANTSTANAYATWVDLLPPEQDRVGMAAPLMVGDPRDFPTTVALLMAFAFFARDKADTVDFARAISMATPGEYFTGADMEITWNGMTLREGTSSLPVPKAARRLMAAGGVRVLWKVLGLTPHQVIVGDYAARIAQLDASSGAAAGDWDSIGEAMEASKP